MLHFLSKYTCKCHLFCVKNHQHIVYEHKIALMLVMSVSARSHA